MKIIHSKKEFIQVKNGLSPRAKPETVQGNLNTKIDPKCNLFKVEEVGK